MRPVIRRGFTLVELLLATALAGALVAVITTTMVRQQRFYRSISEMMEVRAQLRDAADLLASDIRGSATGLLGVPLMTDSAIELFATIATSVACAPPAGNSIGLPPSTSILTSMLAQPDSGDLALIYGVPSGIADSGRWESARITSFTPRTALTGCPPSSGFTTDADVGAASSAYLLTLAVSPSPAVRRGAPIHFVRRGRYSLYRSSDGWYLGYRRCSNAVPSACGAIQPVSGPYRPYAGASGASGLSFRFYDRSGAELNPSRSNALARVDIVVRGQTARAAALTGDARTLYRDSAVISVSPRNRAQ